MKHIIETERLYLRTWREEDLPIYYQINQDPALLEFLPRAPNLSETRDFLQRMNDAYHKYHYSLWGLCLKETSELIGFVGLNYVSFQAFFTPATEISWRISSKFWGNGYATEAAKATLAYGFEVCGLQKIVSFTALKNLRSIRVMEKIGMEPVINGVFSHPKLPENHHLSQHILYELARDTFFTKL